jgi:hypothetical protein
MESIIITPKDSKEMVFINDLLSKLKIRTKIVTLEEKEDAGLAILMHEADRTKKVSRDTIMKKLKQV